MNVRAAAACYIWIQWRYIYWQIKRIIGSLLHADAGGGAEFVCVSHIYVHAARTYAGYIFIILFIELDPFFLYIRDHLKFTTHGDPNCFLFRFVSLSDSLTHLNPFIALTVLIPTLVSDALRVIKCLHRVVVASF